MNRVMYRLFIGWAQTFLSIPCFLLGENDPLGQPKSPVDCPLSVGQLLMKTAPYWEEKLSVVSRTEVQVPPLGGTRPVVLVRPQNPIGMGVRVYLLVMEQAWGVLLLVPAVFKYSPGRSASNQIAGLNVLIGPLLVAQKGACHPGWFWRSHAIKVGLVY